MPKLQPYHRDLPYSYALGMYPALRCLEQRPDLCQRLLLHSRAEEGEGKARLLALAAAQGVRVETADRVIEREAHKENVFAAMVFRKEAQPLAAERPHIVLHQPSDGGNLGTILRTCLGFGLPDIAIIRPATDPYDPRTVRASMGALLSMRLTMYDDFDAYRAAYARHALFPFMLDGAVPLSTVRAPADTPWSLVFGNEARGLPAAFAGAGQAVRIEQGDDIDSLNLSVAVAVGAYAFLHGA